jgi:hypothetical protein
MRQNHMPNDSLRIAMWSGPRNISTALMRAWGSRPDTVVCDEPLYAHYLLTTQDRRHPGFNETLARHETDWRNVAKRLTGPIPDGKQVFYQKHMAHHLLTHIELDWIDQLTNCLLIRHPQEMLTSLAEFLPDPKLADTGLPQQAMLADRLAERTGAAPIVIDARDVLEDPPRMLRMLTERLGVAYDDAMLNWAPGPRDTDGAWAPFWYQKTYQTTGFAPYRPRQCDVPRKLKILLPECEALYAKLYDRRLR